jgi:hypothetical protein
MAEIVDLGKYKEEISPHMSGNALCLNCKHTWVAVAPLGTVNLECPECSLSQGRFMWLVEDQNEPHWTCHCGNQFFHITQKRTYCVSCGDTAMGF